MSIIDHQQHSEPILLFSMYLIFLHPMRQPSGPPLPWFGAECPEVVGDGPQPPEQHARPE